VIFVHPAWLAVGLAACLGALWTWRRYDERQRKALAAFLSPRLIMELTRSISSTRRRVKRALFAAAVALLFVALAEPQMGFHFEQVKRRGNDIVFAVDTSRSMLTPDVKPNRLVRAKLAIDDFVGRLEGDAVGLVAFAGSAFLQCPLTLDYGAFHESLAALDTHIIPRGGTDISSAIRTAQSALHNRAGSDKILILVTDGEDLEGDALETAKAAFKQDGLKIYTVGVGSANGDLIPLPADQGGGFLKDNQGRFVRSRLDEPALRALAQVTGGSYAPLGAANQGLDLIYRQALAPLAKHDLESRTEKVYVERYQWPLAACLACLLASLLVGTRRRAGSLRSAPSAAGRAPASGTVTAAAASVAVIAVLLLGSSRTVHASPATAASAYQRGDFSQAQRDYSAAAARDPAQPILKFDAGTAAYKAGDFPVAAREFQASLDAAKSGSAERLAEQQDAFYNLGNTLYRTGQKTEKSDAQKTIETWTGAVKAYDAALQLRGDDADSKFNRDLVRRKLEQLKKQQQNQSQQNQSHQSQSQNQKSGSKSDQSSQAGQSPNSDKGQPQQGQNQPQQGQNQPQQGQGQQAQPQSGQSQQGQPQPQPGQSQQQGQPQQAQQGQPQQGPVTAAAGGNPQQGQNRAGEENGDEQQRVPGQMSPEEARELLDSVKDEERRAPSEASAGNSEGAATPVDPSRDW
jgi:Ca-activated chloride channel family protein